MTGQMNENGVSTAGKRTQAQFRRFLVERNMSEQTIKAYSYAVKQFYGLYPQLTDKNLQLYKVFLGTKPDDPTFVELFYSVGLALGIFLRRLPALLKLRAHGLCEGWRNGIKLHQDHRNDH